ncbi:hypothetical protein IQ260_24895 [Leptolyngbya cf. ectocarpi LEGE 11479]|uniref:Uncharacterized protein n=1 Tax=Leptolyngbya cf. ectocarpi LEGE 11479 TaxID=1828722 RepID=A0A928ZYL1_LEPEC|nr:hypothetical protein [Leptolyngbya ectocarpi]MBE9069884.1 hypothetical protein [Leptolyngbya cf. ectocarpi LEGE 11479]
MQHLDYFQLFQDDRIIAEGVILPSGQFALSWDGLCHSHGVFPRFEIFQGMQDKRPGRCIQQMIPPPTAGGCSRTFYLQRYEDWSGISGTGLVAVGFEFDQVVMLHWLDQYGSTFWYESVAMVERVHGHEGRTQVARCEMMVNEMMVNTLSELEVRV